MSARASLFIVLTMMLLCILFKRSLIHYTKRIYSSFAKSNGDSTCQSEADETNTNTDMTHSATERTSIPKTEAATETVDNAVKLLHFRSHRLDVLLRNSTLDGDHKVTWHLLNISAGDHPYSLACGIPRALNDEATISSLRSHTEQIKIREFSRLPGQRCILLDLRTQGTMLSRHTAGIKFINKLNTSTRKFLNEALCKDWEPMVLTYETDLRSQVAMLKLLSIHLRSNSYDTWRAILERISFQRALISESTYPNSSFKLGPSLHQVKGDSSTSYGESICKATLQWMCGDEASVQRLRPKWLKSPHSNKSLELDAYCQNAGVAVEYNGKQHYLFDSLSMMNNRVEKDQSKIKQTKSRGVSLVIVPYIVMPKRICNHIVLHLSAGT